MEIVFALLALLCIVLLLLGVVQAVRGVVWLLTASGRQREELSQTALHLRRLRDRGYISAEVYDDVASGLAASQAHLPPSAVAHFAAARTAPPPPPSPPEPTPAAPAEPTPQIEAPSPVVDVETASPPTPPALAQVFSAPPTPPPYPHPLPAEPAGPFASFLEHRNIRWGELLGGLLILGCSAALVVSFWGRMADRPIFKFAVFTLATAAFFALGLYTEHRWRLPITSRAILILATLLVPVNLLAFAALGAARQTGTASLIAQLASLAIFTILVWPASKVLVHRWARLLTVGLSATCLTLIVIAQQPPTPRTVATMAAMPAGCLLICTALVIGRLWRKRSIDMSDALAGYLMLGAIGFAAWLAVGLPMFTAPQLGPILAALSGVFTAMALPAILLGLFFWKRSGSYSPLPEYAKPAEGWAQVLAEIRVILRPDPSQRLPIQRPGYQPSKFPSPPPMAKPNWHIGVSALAVAVFGVAILLSGLLTAWPATGRLLPLAAFDALLLLGVAILFDLPAAYIPATILAAAAWLVGFHTWPGSQPAGGNDSQQIFAALVSAQNGWLLLPIAALLSVSAALAGMWRRRHANMLFGLAVAMWAISFALANVLDLTTVWHSGMSTACFDLLFGGICLLLWHARQDAGRAWAAAGTCVSLLAAEFFTLAWDGQSWGAPVERFGPTLAIGLLIAIPVGIALICWRRKIDLSPGVVFGAALLETIGITLIGRATYGADLYGVLRILQAGHVLTAYFAFGCGVWLRWRLDVGIAAEPIADQSSSAATDAATVLPYRSQPTARRGKFPSVRASGIVQQTMAWTSLAWLLAFFPCLLGDGHISGAAGILALSMLVGTMACWADVPALLFVAGVLLNFAGSWAIMAPPLNRLLRPAQLPAANVILLAVGGIGALLLDRQVFSKRRADAREVKYHLWASWAALAVLIAAWTLQWNWNWFASSTMSPRPDWLLWSALAAVVGLSFIRLAEPKLRDPVGGIYLAGLLGVAFVMGCLPRPWTTSQTVWCLAVGLYSLLTALVGVALVRLLPREHPRLRFAMEWLRICAAIIAGIALWGAASSDWMDQGQRLRLLAAAVACAQGAALGMLAQEKRSMQAWALAVLAVGMVALAWAAMPGEYLSRWLDAASAATGALVAFSLGGAIARRWVRESWRSVLGPVVAVAGCAAALCTVAVVAGESVQFVVGDAILISRLAMIGLDCGLVIGCAAAIAAAIGLPALSGFWRSACVWIAEGLAILALAHLRVTEPGLFSHRIECYWPIIVLGLAFVLSSAGFALNRRGRGELGRPMEYSGIGWPLLAILGYWLWPTIIAYSAVLWIAGVLYAMVAALRRSLWFSLVAAACANGGMWVVFAHYPAIAFYAHPQLWIIPLALSVLAAAQIHHEHIGDEEMRMVRYLCLAVIYLSSTADILLNGVTVAPWLPMVLAALAIAGVLAGIAWHIRPFLYLGTAFLLVAVLTMIWTAQQDLHWTWLWYVAGLAAGVALLAVFGMFEKRHEQMTRLLESLRQWQ